MTGQRAYTFRAELLGYRGIVRTIALREDQTLEALHELLGVGFAWRTLTCTPSG